MNPPSNDDSKFEQFRRERKQRQARYGAPKLPHMAGSVLHEIEAYDSKEIQDQRMAREVNEFLEDATHTAAGIVERVTQSMEAEVAERLGQEMREFLQETLQRAASFMVNHVELERQSQGVQEVEPHMHNLVGPALDSFRYEGTAQLEDKHIGQDPFRTEVEPGETVPSTETPAADDTHDVPEHEAPIFDESPPVGGSSGSSESGAPTSPTADTPIAVDEHLAAEFAAAAPAAADAEPAQHGMLLARICADADTLKRALKALVQCGVMSRDDARTAYREELALLAAEV